MISSKWVDIVTEQIKNAGDPAEALDLIREIYQIDQDIDKLVTAGKQKCSQK